jgi:hypothetical protein
MPLGNEKVAGVVEVLNLAGEVFINTVLEIQKEIICKE